MGLSRILVAGLGNPGTRYDRTRHNIGFEAVDSIASGFATTKWQNSFQSHWAEIQTATGKILLMKPQTFMNLSGQAVGEAVRFYKIDPVEELLVISDDLDLPAGQLRLRLKGGAGGHNGLKSVTEHLGTEDFPRLRLGIGRSPVLPADVYVLSKIEKAEWPLYEKLSVLAGKASMLCFEKGISLAMNEINTWKVE